MPGRIEVDLIGADEIERVMKELGPQLAGKAATAALRAGAKVIQAEAKRLVPKRTRALERSIVVVAETGRRGGSSAGIDAGGAFADKVVRIGFRSPVSRRAHLVEFGTHNSAAQPFMRPALDSKAGEALAEMQESLARALADTAERLNRGG